MMLTRWITRTLLVAMLGIFGTGAVSAAEPMKIGYVDVDLVASRSKSIQDAVKAAEDKLKTRQGELDNLYQQLRSAQNDLKARRSALSEAEVRKQDNRIQELRDQAEALELEVNKELRRAETEVMGPAVDRILAKVKEVGKARGFDLILRSDVVIYGTETFDITPIVVQELDGGAAAPAAAAPAKKGK